MRAFWWAGWVLLGVLALPGCDGAPPPPPKELRFGVVSYGDNVQLEENLGPFPAELAATLGMEVSFVFKDSAQALLRSFRGGELDLSLLSPVMYLRLREDPGAVILVTPAPERNDAAILLVAGNRNGQDLGDFRGLRIVFGPQESTFGNLVPRHYLHQQGIDPQAYFSAVLHAPTQQQALQWLIEGKADIAAVSSGLLDWLPRSGIPADALRTVWRSPPLPGFVIAAHPRLAPELRERIRGVLLGLDYGEVTAQSPASATAGRLLPASDRDLAPFEEMLRESAH